jgi:hypothetical protein
MLHLRQNNSTLVALEVEEIVTSPETEAPLKLKA